MTIECEQRLRQFDLPVPFDAEKLARVVEQVRGRPIFFVPWRRQGRPFGATFTYQDRETGESVDAVCYEELTPHSHQERIKLHELAHLMCGHRSTGLFKHLDTGENKYGVILRNTYSRPEEAMAELMAGLVQSNAKYRALTDSKDPRTREMVERLARYYEDRMGKWRQR
jgi:hypothetical protein